MQRSWTSTGSFSPLWGRKEQTKPMNVSLMTGTGVSQNSGIPASRGSPVSCV